MATMSPINLKMIVPHMSVRHIGIGRYFMRNNNIELFQDILVSHCSSLFRWPLFEMFSMNVEVNHVA